jgi:hypothetical protein
MFNMKKHSDSVLKAREKELGDFGDKYDLDPADNSGNYDYLLREVRREPEGDVLLEKQLEKVRTADSDPVILDKALDASKKAINGMDHRVDPKDSPGPLMDYSIKADKDFEKEFKKAQDKEDRNTEFWDKFVGEQMLGEVTKITNNSQPSQLISNYNTREDFNKQNRSINKKAVALKDADAMLFYLYKNAATEGRDLSKEDVQQIMDINSGKIRILAQHDEPIEKIIKREKAVKDADDIEDKEKERQEIESEESRREKLKNQEEIAGA